MVDNLANLLEAEGKELLADQRVQDLLEAMTEGVKFQDAARSAGLRVKRARLIMQDRFVRADYFKRIDGMKLVERARNVRTIIAIRDKADDPDAKAADRKNAMEAVRYLDGESDGPNITINGNGNVIAGYVVKLTGDSVQPRAIARDLMLTQHEAEDANPLIEHDPVTVSSR